MDTSHKRKLISAWIQHQETYWAWELLHEIVGRSHDEAWPLVIEIAKKSESDDVLGALAVGPMEDMLCAYGDHYFDRVKTAADDCFNFRRALLMGIRIEGERSEKIKQLILEIGKESIQNGWNPNL